MQSIFMGVLCGMLVAAAFMVYFQIRAIKLLVTKLEECRAMVMAAAQVMTKMAKKQGVEVPDLPVPNPSSNPISMI